MYALAKLLNLLRGWDFTLALGLRDHRAGLHLPGRAHLGDLQRGAAFFLIVLGFAPLSVPGPKRTWRLGGLQAKLETVATANNSPRTPGGSS